LEAIENVLAEMEQYAQANHVPIINERGRAAFLQVIRACRPQHVLEIGTAIGYSALQIAHNGAAGVEITTLELSADRSKTAQAYIDRSIYAGQIHIHTGDAAKLLTSVAPEMAPYDFVFIDAAKGQDVDYLQKVEPLLADKAVVLADNVLFRGYVRSEEKPPRRFRTIVKRLREYIRVVTETPGYTTEILENGDGLAVTRYQRP